MYDSIRAAVDAVDDSAVEEERVEVNQRALIDKILARYASAGAVYRELLQNSNDADASQAEIRFTTNNNNNSSSSNTTTAQQAQEQQNSTTATTTTTTTAITSSNKAKPSTSNTTTALTTTTTSSVSSSALVTQVVYRNNGLPFRKQDWSRLRKIAEGNPNPQKVGAFGVGAYTMFSIAEEPMVVSGSSALKFVWKGDALWTKTIALPSNDDDNNNKWTTFVLPSRDPYPLPNWITFGQFLAASLTFTKCLHTVSVFVNDVPVLKIQKHLLQPPQPLMVVDPDKRRKQQQEQQQMQKKKKLQSTTTTTTTTTTSKKWTSWFTFDNSTNDNNSSSSSNANSNTNNKNNKSSVQPSFQTSSPRRLFQLEEQDQDHQPAIYESIYEIVVTLKKQQHTNKKQAKKQRQPKSGTSHNHTNEEEYTNHDNSNNDDNNGDDDNDDDVATIRARHVTATAKVQLPPDMIKRMHRVTKKDPPTTVPLQVYLDAPSTTFHQDNDNETTMAIGLTHNNNNSKNKSLWSSTRRGGRRRGDRRRHKSSAAYEIAQSFRPPAGGGGRIFIGFRTSQTTGVAAHVAAPFLPTVEREAMDLQDATLRIYNIELLQLAGIVLRFTLQHAFYQLQQEWMAHDSALRRRQTLLLQLRQQPQEGGGGGMDLTTTEKIEGDDSEGMDSVLVVEEEEDDDDVVKDSSSTTTTTTGGGGFMGFARFMARGVQKKITSVVTTVIDEVGTQTGLALSSSSSSNKNVIDYAALVGVAPDPRPLVMEEVHAIHWMQSLCPSPSTPDPTVGTFLAQGFGHAMPETPAPCLTQQGVVPAHLARLPAHGMEAFCRPIEEEQVDEEVGVMEAAGDDNNKKQTLASKTTTTTTTCTAVAPIRPPAVIRHMIWEPTQEYHSVIASQCRPLELERDLIPYFRATILTQTKAVRLIQWWKPYSRILGNELSHTLAQQQQRHQQQQQQQLYYHQGGSNPSYYGAATVVMDSTVASVTGQLQAKGLALKDSIRFYLDKEEDDDDINNNSSNKKRTMNETKPIDTDRSSSEQAKKDEQEKKVVVALENYLFYMDKDSVLGKHQHEQYLLQQEDKQKRAKKSLRDTAAETPLLDNEEDAVLLPIPETVLPLRLQELFGATTLSDSAFSSVWFQALPMEFWVEFMAQHPILTQGRLADSKRRLAVLTLLHQEYKDRASSTFRRSNQHNHEFGALCCNVLANVKCIPYDPPTTAKSTTATSTKDAVDKTVTASATVSSTKALVDVPSALYLYSAQLQAFEGVEGSSFHKVSKQLQDAGVTEDFLLALGVRKSVSIDFLFQNLDSLQWNHDPRPLIEYLKSATLTSEDWAKLSQTQYLPAEEPASSTEAKDDATKQQEQKQQQQKPQQLNHNKRNYAPSELYLPSKELRIFPFLKLLQWPTESEVSEHSQNGRFLVRLGMKVLPPLLQVLQYLSLPDLTPEKRTQALDFVANHLSPSASYHKEYNRMSIATRRKYRFLPCTAISPLAAADKATSTGIDKKKDGPMAQELLLSPPSCFSDAHCAVMGFPVLVINDAKKVLGDRREFYASVFQCPQQPEPTALVHQLITLVSTAKRKQQDIKKNDTESRDALNTVILSVFSGVFNYLSHRSSDISSTLLGSLRNESFIPCLIEETNKVEWFRVDQVFFLGRDRSNGSAVKKDSLTEELFQVVEFSPFLAAAGVKQDATTKELFQLLLDDPKAVLEALGKSEKKYRALLRRIAADPPFTVVTDKIRKTPFLLAYTLNFDKSKEGESKAAVDSATYDLAAADDIYIIDNSFFGRMFQVNRAPPETDLEDFYELIGSQYISKSVERRFEVVGKPLQNTDLTRALQERVKERAPLLVSPHVTTRPLVNNAASILDPKRLEFYQGSMLLAVYSLRGITRRSKTTCFSRRSGGVMKGQGQRNSIYVIEDFDWFDVGYALGDLILKRCQLEDAFFISSLLDAPLEQLRARGFPVDRILQPVIVAPPPPPPKPAPEPAKAVAKGVMQPDGTPMVWNPDGTIATNIPPKSTNDSNKNKNEAKDIASNNDRNSNATPGVASAAASQATNADSSDNNEPSGAPKNAGGMEEILLQMFPDADPQFIKGALGPHPSLETVRSLAETMAAGHYPRKDEDPSTERSMDDAASIQTEATSSFDDGASPTEKKKRGRLRKKLGRALGFGGGKQPEPTPPPPPPPAPADGGGILGGIGGMLGGMPPGGGGGSGVSGPSSNIRHEQEGPATPAEDIHSQQNLERMLEETVSSTTNVNQKGLEAPDSLLTSVPDGLDRGETCEAIDGQSLQPFPGPNGTGKARNGIRVFSSGRDPTSQVLLQNVELVESFAFVLENLSKVFGVRLESIAIFNEAGGRSIAFNSNRALHFNIRFFHALHFLPGKPFSRGCYSYWYITMAHELAHNLVSGHNKEHGFYTESFATRYLPRLVDLLANLQN